MSLRGATDEVTAGSRASRPRATLATSARWDMCVRSLPNVAAAGLLRAFHIQKRDLHPRQQEEKVDMDTSHASALQEKHAGLERRIREEMSRPMPDDMVIQQLKKQKLRAKEEIGRH
ncbi:YdcH family protein [Novosphingobium album (ex Liu et al. 2023)]